MQHEAQRRRQVALEAPQQQRGALRPRCARGVRLGVSGRVLASAAARRRGGGACLRDPIPTLIVVQVSPTHRAAARNGTGTALWTSCGSDTLQVAHIPVEIPCGSACVHGGSGSPRMLGSMLHWECVRALTGGCSGVHTAGRLCCVQLGLSLPSALLLLPARRRGSAVSPFQISPHAAVF